MLIDKMDWIHIGTKDAFYKKADSVAGNKETLERITL